MLRKLLYLIAFFSIANTSIAQPPAYAFQAISGTYTPITGGTAVTLTYNGAANYDDGITTPANAVPIGFPFNYNGTSYTAIKPCANGFASFSTTALTNNTDTYTNNLVSGPAANQRPFIAPLWDDMDMGANGTVTYLLSGTTPNRVLTIQWAGAKWTYNALAGVMSFQVKLYETTNVIEFVYQQETGPLSADAGASIGLAATAVGTNTFLSLNNSGANPLVSSTVETPDIVNKPATGQIYRWTPYCTTTANAHTPNELISRVQLSTIDNATTATTQYENFSALSASLQTPSSNPFTITLANGNANDKVFVWIDYNHNGSFTDAGELVYTGTGAGPFTGNIAIPALSANVLPGLARMRIKVDNSTGTPSNTTPCGLSDYGQVEDYTINIFVCTAAAVVTQPANTVICSSGNGTISVGATGTGLTYQWQVSTNGGTSFTDLLNVLPYSGVTTSTLTITGATTTMSGYQYRVIINGICTPANTASNAATLTINTPTAITTQPVITQTCAGGNASFSVAASSNAGYQWQVSTDGGMNYTNIANATSTILNLTGVTNAMNGNRYRAVASVQSCNTVNSNGAILTVNALPTITLGAAPITSLTPGLTTVLSAAAVPGSSGNSFTWYRNGVQVAVTNVNSLLLNLNINNLGKYTAKVTDSKGCTSLLSNEVSITDSLNNRLFITPNPSTGFFQVRYFRSLVYAPGYFARNRTMNIFDPQGKLVMQRAFTVDNPWGAMDVNLMGYSKGIYLVEIRDYYGKFLVAGKVLIQ